MPALVLLPFRIAWHLLRRIWGLLRGLVRFLNAGGLARWLFFLAALWVAGSEAPALGLGLLAVVWAIQRAFEPPARALGLMAAPVVALGLGGVRGLLIVIAAAAIVGTIAVVAVWRSGRSLSAGELRAAGLERSRAARLRRYARRRARRLVREMMEHTRPELPARPKILEAAYTLSGPQVVLRLPSGSSLSQLESSAERLSVALAVREVRFRASDRDASVVTARIIEADPLAKPLPAEANPWLAIHEMTALDPIPLGVDEDGQALQLKMAKGGASVLIGGSPGSGKSLVHAFVASACLDPSAIAVVVDLKGGIELQAWEPYADVFATTLPEAAEALARIELEMDARLRWMRSQGLRDLPAGFPRVRVVVDEAAELLRPSNPSDREASKSAESSLTRLVALGRAVGIQVAAATQKPTSDSLPTAFRDLIGYRIAFRTGTVEQAKAILGPDALAKGADPTSIPVGAPGLGYATTETGEVRRFRAWHFSDDLVAELAGRCDPFRVASHPPLPDLVGAV